MVPSCAEQTATRGAIRPRPSATSLVPSPQRYTWPKRFSVLIRFAVACHAAARYDRLFRQSGKQILEQHSLLIRLVERLHDHITAGEQPLHVGRNDSLGVSLVGKIGIDGLKLLNKRERFRDAKVFHRVMLTVEVGDVHHIEIHEAEMTNTHPRQKDRKVGAKPAQTRNADTRLVQLSLNIRAVAFHQCVMQLFFG